MQLRFVIQDGKRILQSRMTMLPTRNAAGDIVLYVPDEPQDWSDVPFVEPRDSSAPNEERKS